MIPNYNFKFCPWLLENSHTINNSLDLLITVENSLEILKTPQGFSYIPLMMQSLRKYLLDPHFCGFRVLVLLTNYRVPRYFTILDYT